MDVSECIFSSTYGVPVLSFTRLSKWSSLSLSLLRFRRKNSFQHRINHFLADASEPQSQSVSVVPVSESRIILGWKTWKERRIEIIQSSRGMQYSQVVSDQELFSDKTKVAVEFPSRCIGNFRFQCGGSTPHGAHSPQNPLYEGPANAPSSILLRDCEHADVADRCGDKVVWIIVQWHTYFLFVNFPYDATNGFRGFI